MPDPATQACPQREAVAALAREELPDDRRRVVQHHLEHCEPCRAAFRALTADRYPRLRSYTIVRCIGRGAYGEVYQAVHHSKQRTEAVKVLHTRTRFSATSFENEAHLVARLRHPNIATLYDAHLGTPPFFYSMEFVEGRRLNDHFSTPDVSVAERISIFRRVALAMDYSHRAGVVHCDLKPQNIVIDAAGEPRIVDFGIARKLALAGEDGHVGAERPGHAEGTDGYMAPEQEAGRAVDGRADIYALGVLLYQGVTGNRLSSDRDRAHLNSALRQRGISRARDLGAIIARCLAVEPAGRYATCAELAEDLGRFLAGQTVHARGKPTLRRRATRRVTAALRRHTLLARVVLALAVGWALFEPIALFEPRWLAPGPEERSVVLIAFKSSTMEAVRDGRIGADLDGLTLGNRKSWRMLYGQLMEVLAEAPPRAVVWDYYFPDCQPEYDPAFIRGVEALHDAGAPVVIGCRDYDVNGAPRACEHILAAVHACGALYFSNADTKPDEFLAPLCFVRGLNAPVPALAVAGFAAARHPDCDLDLRIEDKHVVACYHRIHHAQGEAAWHTETDEFSLVWREPDQRSHLLQPDDEVLYARVRKAATDEWTARTFAFEDVLTASSEQLQSWFSRSVVVVGQMLPGQDVFPDRGGAQIHGCQVQAQTLDAFLVRGQVPRVLYVGLALRILGWCALAAIVAQLLPVRSLNGLRRVILVCLGLCLLGIVIGELGVLGAPSRWIIEAVLGTSTLLIAGSLVYLCRTVQARQARIAPGPSWPAAHDTTSADSTGGI